MEYDKNIFKFICTINLWFNSGHCHEVQFSKAFSSTRIYHINYGFARKNLSPKNGITVSKSLDSLILMKTLFSVGINSWWDTIVLSKWQEYLEAVNHALKDMGL
jgi:hypothetical protein